MGTRLRRCRCRSGRSGRVWRRCRSPFGTDWRAFRAGAGGILAVFTGQAQHRTITKSESATRALVVQFGFPLDRARDSDPSLRRQPRPLLPAAHRAADVERVAPVGRGRVVRVATRRWRRGRCCVATPGNERPTLACSPKPAPASAPGPASASEYHSRAGHQIRADASSISYKGEKRRNYTLYEPTRQPFKEIAKLAHTSGETYKASPKRKTCAQRGTVHTATRLSMRMSMLAPTSAPAAAAAAEENSGGGTEGSKIRFRVSLHSFIRRTPSSPCTAAAACGPPCRLGLIARFPILRYKSFEASLPSAAIHPAYTRHTNLP